MSDARIIFVGGGTGGHLAPCLAVATRWQAAGHGAEVVISRKPVDARMAAAHPELPVITAPGAGWSGGLGGRLQSIRQGLLGLIFAGRHLRRSRPRAVFGFGGFLTGIYAAAARLTRTPLVLHEANRVPGRAIRSLARGATRLYLPAGVKLARVAPMRIREVGVPLRPSVQHIPKADVRQKLAIPRWDKVLLVLGGSQGAASLTQWTRDHLDALFARGIHVICLTGMKGGPGETVRGEGPSGCQVEARFLPFSDNMAELLSVADVVVSRAGAGSIAEIIRCIVPAILVPYPHAADDHQRANATYLERRGGAVVVQPEALDTLWEEVHQLIHYDRLLERMRGNLRALAREDAAGVILHDLETRLATPLGALSPAPTAPLPSAG